MEKAGLAPGLDGLSLRLPKWLVRLVSEFGPAQSDIVEIALRQMSEFLAIPITLPPDVKRLGDQRHRMREVAVMMICHRL
jgi:hypothetical protein